MIGIMSLHLFGGLLLINYFFSLFAIIQCKVVEESSTGAIISFPEISDGDLYNITWEVEPAAFGFADYGGTLEAYLILPQNITYHTQCEAEDISNNPYIHYIKDYEPSETDFLWIMVIDRGDCYFASKVYNAEQNGASGVIMLDNKEEDLFPMWEPDNFDNDITIPSVEMAMHNGATLMQHLGVRNWNPKNTENMTYPSAGDAVSNNSFVITKALIEWGLPHEDDRVEWEMWTSSNDDRTMDFKRNFKSTSLMLDFANDTVFTPHYYILNGSHWSCDTNRLRCGNQCSNSGRYCAVDPEGDLNNGISGIDVVQEDLRQLCIWNFTQRGELNDPIYNLSIWWDYSILWNDNCFNDTTNENTFNTECSYRQMATLDSDGSLGLAAYVNNCINASGGYGYYDGNNSLLEYEVKFREDLNVYTLPSFRVNEFMIYGEVDCDIVTEDGCSILDSICAGFIDGTEPDICHATPAPTVANCSNSERDCSGECFGTKQYDRCGSCLETSSTKWDNCVGCDNVTNSGFETNDCGYCLNSSRSDFDSYGKNCHDDCTTNYDYDDCGICRYLGSSDWNGCFGCDDVAHSGKEYNPCGYCILNTTSNFDTYGEDCSGECGGSKQTDECGNCLETSDSDWNSCVSSSSSDNSSNASLSGAVIAIGIIAFIVIVIAGIVIYKMYQKQKEQSRQFDNILKTYTLMDENPGNQGGKKKKDRMAVPTEDIDDVDSNGGDDENGTQDTIV